MCLVLVKCKSICFGYMMQRIVSSSRPEYPKGKTPTKTIVQPKVTGSKMPKRKQKCPRYKRPTVDYLPRDWEDRGQFEEQDDGTLKWVWDMPWYIRFERAQGGSQYKYVRLQKPGSPSPM